MHSTSLREKSDAAFPLRGSAVRTGSVTVETEPAARDIYCACDHALSRLLTTIHEGDVDAHGLASAMCAMVESVQRDPGAILLLNAERPPESYERERAMNTAILMVAFGRHLQYPGSRLEVLGLAGMLLDVGMTMLPPAVVQAFNADEAVDDALVESHVLHSVELIRSARGLPQGIDEVVILHHERQDGEGYPYGLARDQISVDGAIGAIVDSYSKLTVARPRGGEMPASRALGLLREQRGAALHKGLTEQFIEYIHDIRCEPARAGCK